MYSTAHLPLCSLQLPESPSAEDKLWAVCCDSVDCVENVQYEVCSLQCSVCSVQCEVCNVHSTVCGVPCSVCSVLE